MLAGGRSSEHDVSLRSAALRARRARRGRPRRAWPSSSRATARGGATARRSRCAPGAGCSDADVGLPGAARPVRRGRHGAGPARAARRAPTSARACWPARCAWTRSLFKDADGPRRACRRCAYAVVDGRRRPRRARRGRGRPARAGSSRPGWAPRSASRASTRRSELEAALEAAFGPRPARDRRGERRGASRSSARSSAPPTRRWPASPARSCSAAARTAGTTTRPSTRRAGWSSWSRRGSPPPRASACARWRSTAFRLAGCSGLARADFFVDGEDVLLNELNTMPGFTADERLRQALGAQRRALPRAVRPAVRIAVERFERERLHRF